MVTILPLFAVKAEECAIISSNKNIESADYDVKILKKYNAYMKKENGFYVVAIRVESLGDVTLPKGFGKPFAIPCPTEEKEKTPPPPPVEEKKTQTLQAPASEEYKQRIDFDGFKKMVKKDDFEISSKILTAPSIKIFNKLFENVTKISNREGIIFITYGGKEYPLTYTDMEKSNRYDKIILFNTDKDLFFNQLEMFLDGRIDSLSIVPDYKRYKEIERVAVYFATYQNGEYLFLRDGDIIKVPEKFVTFKPKSGNKYILSYSGDNTITVLEPMNH